MLTIHCDDGDIILERDGTTVAAIPMSLRNIFRLEKVFAHLQTMDIFDGDLRILFKWKGKDPGQGLRQELLLQLIGLVTVYHVYPKVSEKAPNRPGDSREDFEHHINTIWNLPIFGRLCHCWKLAGYVASRPAVLVAPGPAIDFKLLRHLSGSTVIIAVGRALPRLRQAGITPDFLYVQETSASGWGDIFGPEDGTILDTTLICNPAGPIHAFLHRVTRAYKAWNFYPHESDFMPKIEEIAPSSTTGAFSLARLFGPSDIIFMGCDCGEVVEDQLPFLRECLFSISELLDGDDFPANPRDVPSWYLLEEPGKTILTKSDYIACAQWIKTRLFLNPGDPAPNCYDNSGTGFLRQHGLALPFPKSFDFSPYVKPPLPSHDTRFDPAPVIKRHLSRYTYIKRHLQRGPSTPEASLQRPYNCIYKDVARYSGKPLDLDDHERALVLGRVDSLLEALGKAASAIAG